MKKIADIILYSILVLSVLYVVLIAVFIPWDFSPYIKTYSLNQKESQVIKAIDSIILNTPEVTVLDTDKYIKCLAERQPDSIYIKYYNVAIENKKNDSAEYVYYKNSIKLLNSDYIISITEGGNVYNFAFFIKEFYDEKYKSKVVIKAIGKGCSLLESSKKLSNFKRKEFIPIFEKYIINRINNLSSI